MKTATLICRGFLRPMGFRIALAIVASCTIAPQARAGGVVSICDEARLVAAASGGGTVTFGCSGTISLSNTLYIASDTVIDGTGQNVTLTGTGDSGLLHVGDCRLDTSPSLTVSNLTFAGATNYGAIVNTCGDLAVVKATFKDNWNSADGIGGAIENVGNGAGTVTVQDSTFTANHARRLTSNYFSSQGGAIFNAGVLSVLNSTFEGNEAGGDGGAIYNEGKLMVTNSTFRQNSVEAGTGGNIANSNYFGGYSWIHNSTIVEGQAASGASNVWAGSGPGSLRVMNTIIANPGGSGPNCEGPLIDDGGNLQWPWPVTGGGCIGTVGDPQLGPLQNNGGFTATMALLPGSAAIDAGLDGLFVCPVEDQRHVLRPQGTHCDIGAFEASIADLLLRTVRLKLTNFLGYLSPGQSRTLSQQVLGPLSASLDPSLWQGTDGNHLAPRSGRRVFRLHETAVKNLADCMADTTALDYVQTLVVADRTLAEVAIEDAKCSPGPARAGTPGGCAQAVLALAKGDASVAANNYGDAIEHYKEAWSSLVVGASHDD